MVRGVLEDGLSAREAVEKVRLGDLEAPAFDMPVSTAQPIIRQAKLRGRVDGLSDRMVDAAEKIIAYAERQVAKVEQLEKEGEPDDVVARRAAATLREGEKLLAAIDLRPAVLFA